LASNASKCSKTSDCDDFAVMFHRTRLADAPVL
jgi:hypothetical protein